MTVRELRERIKDAPDDAQVKVNTIYISEGEWEPSDIYESHYDEGRNAVLLTPEIISIHREDDDMDDEDGLFDMDDMDDMDDIEMLTDEMITDDLIRVLMFYGIHKTWPVEKLKEKYKMLELDEERVNAVLNQGIEE